MRPYTPLELAGRNIYIREGCYVCHSQMIRPFRDEVERYGHYSLAAESMYDHPFQWGSKRTGPDLARVGGRYSDDWHVAAPDRPALGRAGIDHAAPTPSWPRRALDVERHRRRTCARNARVGVPYTDDDDRQRRRRPRAPRPIPTPTTPALLAALSQGAGRATSTAIRPASPRWTRWSPICRCSARWSTSRPTSRDAEATGGERHDTTKPCATSPTAGAVWSHCSSSSSVVVAFAFRPGAATLQFDRRPAFRLTTTDED